MIGYKTLLVVYPHRLMSNHGPTEWDDRVLWAGCGHAHQSPARECSCGVWAYHDDAELMFDQDVSMQVPS